MAPVSSLPGALGVLEREPSDVARHPMLLGTGETPLALGLPAAGP